MYSVYSTDRDNKKKHYFGFTTRGRARAFCKFNKWDKPLHIIHPDGTQELFEGKPLLFRSEH